MTAAIEARVQAFRQPLGWEAYAMIKRDNGHTTPRYLGTYPSAAALEMRVHRDAHRFGWGVVEHSYFGAEAWNVLEDWRRLARVKPDGIWGSF